MMRQFVKELIKVVLQFALDKVINLLFQRPWARGYAPA